MPSDKWLNGLKIAIANAIHRIRYGVFEYVIRGKCSPTQTILIICLLIRIMTASRQCEAMRIVGVYSFSWNVCTHQYNCRNRMEPVPKYIGPIHA